MLKTLLRPRFWPGHLAMLVCVAIAVTLGTWQLDAWQTRRADAAVDVSNADPVALDSVMNGGSEFPGRSLGRPVTLTGTWIPTSTLFVSDRKLGGKSGFWVVTPVQVEGSDSAIPVVRGWSEASIATTPHGEVTVTGWLQATEAAGPIDDHPEDQVLPGMRLASMVEHVDVDLYSAYVVARDVAGDGGPDATNLLSVSASAVPEVSGFTALRNFLYGIEWFVFGAFAFFVWYRWCRDSLESLAAADAVEEAAEVDA